MTDVRITVSKDGSLKVEGQVELVDDQDRPIQKAEGRPFFLCRCGHSQNKPFCDGSHKRAGFSGS